MVASVTLKKLGVGTINMTLNAHQFTNLVKNQSPSFFQADGTGGFFGLAGYRATVPCYVPFNQSWKMVRFYGFTLNATGIQTVIRESAGDNFTHISGSDGTQGQAPYPVNLTSYARAIGQAMVGPDGLYIQSDAPIPGNTGGAIAQQHVPFNPVNFTDDNNSFASDLANNNLTEYAAADLTGVFCPGHSIGFLDYATTIPYLVRDITGAPLIAGGAPFSFGYNPCGFGSQDSFFPFASQFIQGSGAFEPYAQQINFEAPPYGVNSALFCMGTTNSIFTYWGKVNPANGNFVMGGVNWLNEGTGSAYIYCGNAFVPTPASTSNLILQQLHFDDPNLEAQFNNTLSNLQNVIDAQCAGGGFLLTLKQTTNQSSYPFIFIMPDLSGYFLYNVTFPVGLQIQKPSQIGTDFLGYLFVKDGATQLLYSSVGGPATLILNDPPQIYGSGLQCRRFNRCNTSFEG